MQFEGRSARLQGRHFLVNIALPENLPGGLTAINRDPRKQARKPDVYAGVVEEVGEGCFLVKPGDRVAFRRWEWEQLNVDDERLIAEEEDLVILAHGNPAPGMIVVRLIQEAPKTTLALPDTVRAVRSPSLRGEVLAFSPYRMGELKGVIQVGQVLHFQRSKDDQWALPDGRAILKVSRYYEIMAIEEKDLNLSVV